VTRRATDLALHVVRGGEVATNPFLVRGRLPRHREHVITWTQKRLRILVTVEAEAHLHRLRFESERHLIDATVTRRAADTLIDVDAVVEIHEAWQVRDAIPGNRLVGREAGADRCQRRALRPDLGVAVHARLGRRHARERRRLDGRVAIATVDAVVGDVVLVAERNRLLDGLTDLGHPRRTHVELGHPEGHRCPDDAAEKDESKQAIGARSKDLWHAGAAARCKKRAPTNPATSPLSPRHPYRFMPKAAVAFSTGHTEPRWYLKGLNAGFLADNVRMPQPGPARSAR